MGFIFADDLPLFDSLYLENALIRWAFDEFMNGQVINRIGSISMVTYNQWFIDNVFKATNSQIRVAYVMISFHVTKKRFERDEFQYYMYGNTEASEALDQDVNVISSADKKKITDSFSTIIDYDRDKFLTEFVKLDYGSHPELLIRSELHLELKHI